MSGLRGKLCGSIFQQGGSVSSYVVIKATLILIADFAILENKKSREWLNSEVVASPIVSKSNAATKL